jgi:hypothetical protein
MWTLDGKCMNWKVEKKYRNTYSVFFISCSDYWDGQDSNILDEYVAKNEWNFSKVSKTNRSSFVQPVKIVHSDSAEVWPNQSESIRWCCRIKSESWWILHVNFIWMSREIRPNSLLLIPDLVLICLFYFCSVHTRIQKSKLVYWTVHPLSLMIDDAHH